MTGDICMLVVRSRWQKSWCQFPFYNDICNDISIIIHEKQIKIDYKCFDFEKYKLFTRVELAENTNVIIDVCRHYANSR